MSGAIVTFIFIILAVMTGAQPSGTPGPTAYGPSGRYGPSGWYGPSGAHGPSGVGWYGSPSSNWACRPFETTGIKVVANVSLRAGATCGDAEPALTGIIERAAGFEMAPLKPVRFATRSTCTDTDPPHGRVVVCMTIEGDAFRAAYAEHNIRAFFANGTVQRESDDALGGNAAVESVDTCILGIGGCLI